VQLLRRYSFDKKLQSLTVILPKTLLYKKAACEMLVKLTPGWKVSPFTLLDLYAQMILRMLSLLLFLLIRCCCFEEKAGHVVVDNLL